MRKRSITLSIFLGCVLPVIGQTVVDIKPGLNNKPITRVVYEVDGNTVVQNTEATGVSVNRNQPVYLKSVTINDGGSTVVLDSFNSLGATVTNINFSTSTSGVGIFDNGIITTTSNLAAYQAALVATTQDTDLLNYSFYDGVSNMPPSGVHDYDMLFERAFNPEDRILVSERWGNTYFTLRALDANGNTITGTNLLRFGYPTGSAYSLYDWNSGYATSTYINDQAFAFTVASASLFFTGTSVAPQPVFGFRVDNDGEADVKFFGLSDNSFANNPAIPEPSASVLLSGAVFALLSRRKR